MEYEIRRPIQPIVIEFTFISTREIENLYEDLRAWTPSAGWSEEAEEFFMALRAAVTDK